MTKILFLPAIMALVTRFQFGELQEIPEVKPILELLERASSIVYTNTSNPRAIFDKINGPPDYVRFLRLQNETLSRIELLPNINELRRNQLEGPYHSPAAARLGGNVSDILRTGVLPHIVVLVYMTRQLCQREYQDSDLGDMSAQLVKIKYTKYLKELGDMQRQLAPIPNNHSTEEKRGLAELYEIYSNANLLHQCGSGKSPQQVLRGLFADIIQLELMGTQALIHLTIIKSIKERASNVDAWRELREQFIQRYNTYVESFGRTMDKVTRDHRSCDPARGIGWKRGTSFFELEKTIQATAFHRSVSASRRSQWPDCNGWAAALMNKQSHENTTCKDQDSDGCWMDPVEKCSGVLSSCFSITTTTKRCINAPGNPRRYKWLHDGAEHKYNDGIDIECSEEGRHLNRGFGDTCSCACSEDNNKLSLELSSSDVEKNRVITAMRLARIDNIVLIQIKQGTLQPDGKIVNQSTSWEPSQVPKKFTTLTTQLRFELDNLQYVDDTVLTGMQFAKTEKNHPGVQLKIEVVKFNYTTGKLLDETTLIFNWFAGESRAEEIVGTKNPATSELKNVATTAMGEDHKRYIKFTMSDLRDDSGQTTLPLFDMVPVEGNPPSPLAGAGIIYKKAPGYGGFLSLRAIGINVAKYFKETVKPLAS